MSTQRNHRRLSSIVTRGLAPCLVAALVTVSGAALAGGSSDNFSVSADDVVAAAGFGASANFSLLSAVDGGPVFAPASSASFSLQRSGALGAALATLVGEDTDDDGIPDRTDNCDFVQNPGQENSDDDAEGDACDADDDNDGTPDELDAFPFDPKEDTDTDGDGIGNNADRDDDGDGVDDRRDAFPLDASEQVDTDRDGIGNNADPDDDEDGLSDEFEVMNGLNPLDKRDARADADRDNFSNLEESQQGTGVNDADDWPMPVMTTDPDLEGHTGVFSWTFPAELSIRRWLVQVGTTPGGRDVVRGVAVAGDARSVELKGLPTQGGELFVTLNFDRGRGYRNPKGFTFNAADLPEPGVTPAGGSLASVQAGSEVTLALETNGNDVTHWSLEVLQPSATGRDRRLFRRTLRGTDTQVTLTGLPTFGELVMVRLGYRLSRRAWQYRSFEFSAANPGEPEIVTPSPTDGAAALLKTGNGASGFVEFTWTANGQPVSQWRLYVGSTRGGRELYASRRLRGDVLTLDTRRVFPQSQVHVRLFYRIGRSPERFVDYVYNPLDATLRPLYPATGDMGLIAPVRNDGPDIFSASGRLCGGRERGSHEACLQAGLMKVMTLPTSVASCATVSVADALDAFEWECRDTVPVEVVSVGLKGSFVDLIDASVPAFRSNQVIVEDGSVEVARSDLEPWWSTPVLPLPVDGVMRDANTVYVVESATPGVNPAMNRAARSLLLVSPDVVGPVAAEGVSGGTQVSVLNSPFAVVQGDYAAAGESTVIFVDRSPFATVTGVRASGAVTTGEGRRAVPGTGIRVRSSNNVLVSDVVAVNNEGAGILLERSTGVWLMESASLGNGTGVLLERASGNGLFDVRARHNGLGGIVLERSGDNRLHQLVVNNNGAHAVDSGGHGIEVIHPTSRRNVIGFAQVFNNAGDGVFLDGARNTLLHNVTAFNHPGGGVVMDRTVDTTLLSTMVLNNGDFGLGLIGGTQRTQVQDLVAAHNGVGVHLSGRSRRNTFAGVLKVGGNAVACEVEAGSDSLGDGDCAPTGASEHTVVTGVDASMTLAGKRSETGDHDTLVADPDALEDLGAAEGSFSSRGYGRDGGAFPDADNRGPCVSGETCRVWDGATASDDAGDAGSPVAAQVLAVPEAGDVVSHRLRRPELLLLHASEVLFDGLGDEDGLCESGEACNLDLNIGAFQGEEGDGVADDTIGFDLLPPVRGAPPRAEDVELDSRTGTTVAVESP